MGLAKALGGRVRQARGTLSQPQLAQLVSVHFNTIGKIELGKSVPDAELLVRIAEATHVSPAWLLMGAPFVRDSYAPPSLVDIDPEHLDAGAPQAGVPKSVQALEWGGFIYVPHFNLDGADGSDLQQVTAVESMWPLKSGFVRTELGIGHNLLALIDVRGRAMEPRLHPRDMVLVDLHDRDAKIEGMHLIRLEGALLIKGLQRLPGRKVRVTSQNPEYASFDIAPEEETERDFAVLGRLRWAGVTL